MSEQVFSLEEKKLFLESLEKKTTINAENEPEDSTFLATPPIRQLVARNRTRLPIVVSIGAKGAGKTFIYRKLLQKGNWKAFAQSIGDDAQDAKFIPVLAPPQRNNTLGDEVRAYLKDQMQVPEGDIADLLEKTNNALKTSTPSIDTWLDVIAWRANFEKYEAGAGRRFVKHLQQTDQHYIALVDGLEMFTDFRKEHNQQKMIESLINELPNWLADQPKRNLGLIVFIRQDIATYAIRLNFGQLKETYQDYALKWNAEEALRLFALFAHEADEKKFASPSEMQRPQLKEALYPLWGKKLGQNTSREAESARWVVSALSNFNGDIQARDVVQLLNTCAKKGAEEAFPDRFIAPDVLRRAVETCSERKVEESREEDAILGELFDKLKKFRDEIRRVPFQARDVSELSAQELAFLEDSGVLYRDGDDYYMAEIYRYGLNFDQAVRGRSRIVALLRRVIDLD